MKSQNSAAKSTQPKRKPVAKETVLQAGLSLEPVFSALRKRYPVAAQSQAVAFASAFYKRMEADEFCLHSAEEWAVLAADMFEFVRVRKPGKANVRAFNPTLKADGWESPHTVLQIVNDDMPFLVDTVSLALAEQGIGVHVLGHPVIVLARDKAGKLSGVGEGAAESVMLLEIDRQPAAGLEAVAKRISAVLEDVRAIVKDWKPMRDQALALAGDLASAPCRSARPRALRRRSSCAGPPTTTSPSSATASTRSKSRAAKRCWSRRRVPVWA